MIYQNITPPGVSGSPTSLILVAGLIVSSITWRIRVTTDGFAGNTKFGCATNAIVIENRVVSVMANMGSLINRIMIATVAC